MHRAQLAHGLLTPTRVAEERRQLRVEGELSLAESLMAHGADLNIRLTRATQARRSQDDYAFDRKLIGATPFMLAARDGEAAFMRAFAAAGADTSIGLSDGSQSLAVAARGRQHFRTAQTGGVGQPSRRVLDQRALAAVKVGAPSNCAVFRSESVKATPSAALTGTAADPPRNCASSWQAVRNTRNRATAIKLGSVTAF